MRKQIILHGIFALYAVEGNRSNLWCQKGSGFSWSAVNYIMSAQGGYILVERYLGRSELGVYW